MLVVGFPTVIATFFVMYVFKFSLNMMTLLALSLSIGLLIDDAVVVRENIQKHLERGEDPRTAALNGTKEIALSVLSNFLLGLLFGAAYSENAGPTLRILIAAACPLVIVDHFIALTRIQGRTLAAARLVWPTAIGQLVLAALGAILGGLPGLSLAWVIGVCVEALLMTPYVWGIVGFRLAWTRR